MASFESDAYQRTEPLALKPSTLPHIIDDGAGGERFVLPLKTTVSTQSIDADVIRIVSSTSQDSGYQNFWPMFCISMRILFYIVVLILTVGITLAACKLTNIWDPCQHLYINTTECKVTSYMKGMIYHSDCTEEYYCVLPGFESNVKRQGWTFQRPNETDTIQAQAQLSM